MRISHLQSNKGSTLLDVLVGSALLLIVFLGLFGAFQLSLVLVETAKLRTGALALAQDRIEYIRSLQYDDVGTVGGIPQGILESEEALSLNGISYTRRTFVQYTDAPEDGSGALDENSITTDYKTVKVTLEWETRNGTRETSLVSNIVPDGIESVVGGGTLRITVLNALSAAVPSAQVNIVNNDTSPAISLSTFTNTEGVVELPGAPAASNYEVSISKSGYSGAQTYSVTGQNTNPSPGHLSVTESETTADSFFIDTLGSITVRTFEYGTTTSLFNIPFSIRGDKTIGTDSGSNPIYKYTGSLDTGGSGTDTESSLEWDNYTITINDTVTGYDIAEICPANPLSLNPGDNTTVDIYLDENTTHTLLVSVVDVNGDPLNGASVHLYRGAYDTTNQTATCGQTFFNNSLSEGTAAGSNPYSLSVSLSGYQTYNNSSVDVSDDSTLTVTLSTI